jgi:hypothetical protein
LTPHVLAKKYEICIKNTINEIYNVSQEQLTILWNEEKGVYFSEQKQNVFCCLVVCEDGYLYLVTAKLNNDGQKLSGFNCKRIG